MLQDKLSFCLLSASANADIGLPVTVSNVAVTSLSSCLFTNLGCYGCQRTERRRRLVYSLHHGYPIASGVRPHSLNYQEFAMNKDQAKGRLEEAKGKVKEVAGNLVGNDDLELKGKIQKSGGKVQSAYGDLKEDLKDASKGK